MTVESMKTLTPVPAPPAGTVKAVSVEIDQIVDAGELLLLLTAKPTASTGEGGAPTAAGPSSLADEG